MKIKALNAFYMTETGIVKRGQILDVPDQLAMGLSGGGYAEFVKEEFAPSETKAKAEQPKKTSRTKKA